MNKINDKCRFDQWRDLVGGVTVIMIPAGRNVFRTWSERLLSWPWQPWRKTKWVPNDNCKVGDTLHVTPEAYSAIKAQSLAVKWD